MDDWRPDPVRAWERFRSRRRARAARRRNTLLVVAAGAVTALIFADITPRACANPRGCEEPQPAADSHVPAKLTPAEFKAAGNPSAKITVEVYSDYQCPDCARFFLTVVPLLDAEFVKTGKIRFLHRDFPLPQHAWAKLAARYANAAGEIGKYDIAVNALFRSRDQWSVDGNPAAALAKALAPDEMKSVQRAVDSDTGLDETVNEDMKMALKDQIMHTPTLVIVTPAGRQVLTYNVSYETLKGYLNALLAGSR